MWHLAKSKLQEAQDDVKDLSDGVDVIKLTQRKTAVKIAKNTLKHRTHHGGAMRTHHENAPNAP